MCYFYNLRGGKNHIDNTFLKEKVVTFKITTTLLKYKTLAEAPKPFQEF